MSAILEKKEVQEIFNSKIDNGASLQNDKPIIWLTCAKNGGHSYLFLEYIKTERKYYFWSSSKHVIEKIDYVPMRDRFREENRPAKPDILCEEWVGNSDILEKITFAKRGPFALTREKLRQLHMSLKLMENMPPQYNKTGNKPNNFGLHIMSKDDYLALGDQPLLGDREVRDGSWLSVKKIFPNTFIYVESDSVENSELYFIRVLGTRRLIKIKDKKLLSEKINAILAQNMNYKNLTGEDVQKIITANTGYEPPNFHNCASFAVSILASLGVELGKTYLRQWLNITTPANITMDWELYLENISDIVEKRKIKSKL